MENKQRTVLITGASRGIGRGIALEFARAGYNVIINYLNNDKAAKESLEDAGKFSRAITIKADIRDESAVKNMYKEARANFGFIDTLINNAGINRTGLFIDESENEALNIFQTNVLGPMRVCRAFLPDMLSSSFGRIINISSIWGVSGASMETSYSATKAALIGFTKALSKEVLPMGVTVNAIAPGLIDTDMTRSVDKEIIERLMQSIMAGRIGKPDDIARAALFLADLKSDYISGHILNVTGEYLPSSL